MQTTDFHFDLPPSLIAQKPSPVRGNDRLLCLDRHTGAFEDHLFSDIASLIHPDTLMVFNDSRVRHARIFGIADSSGNKAEFLLISLHLSPSTQTGTVWKVMARNAKRHKPGRTYTFTDGTKAHIISDPSAALEGTEFRLLEFDKIIDDTWLDHYGHLPLPPYITRDDEPEDADRYQTIYAQTIGSVAAPTAGLHFTADILSQLKAKHIEQTSVTLHVGLGTFLPVRTEHIEDHTMHEETYSVSTETAAMVNKAQKEGRPILAVGTTSIRTLESSWDSHTQSVLPGNRSTSIFMYPGYQFRVVNQVFTNFHTPESTLLMLVSAFAGKDQIMSAYAHAIEQKYRFFSYGDAMLIR